ncbi:hypothetical protein LSH36_129g03011 [Paralvinella palmiformis]|uniref:Promethin n=1 Tax=Paralvinella palmiformis TaxID=53620 RepID=A0AAD9JX21_9ANNE|nr:hypothetical protein LSH36_129g03011 [Paralvinella palmiformis]
MCANRTSGFTHYDAAIYAADTFERAWHRMATILERAWIALHMDEKLEALKQYTIDHPIMTLGAVLTFCMCSIPITCFLFFVMGSLFLTFLGFIFVEGFLLTLASVLLGGALFIVGMLSIGASSILAVAWCVLTAGTGCFTAIKSKIMTTRYSPRHSLFSFLSYEHTNGECVKELGPVKAE